MDIKEYLAKLESLQSDVRAYRSILEKHEAAPMQVSTLNFYPHNTVAFKLPAELLQGFFTELLAEAEARIATITKVIETAEAALRDLDGQNV